MRLDGIDVKKISREIISPKIDRSEYYCRYNNLFYKVKTDREALVLYINGESPEDLAKLQKAATEDWIAYYNKVIKGD